MYSPQDIKDLLKKQIQELHINQDNLEVLLPKQDVADILQIDNISTAGHKTFMSGILFALEGLLEEIEDEEMKGGE
jgi:hypothetical protein